jgi:hypothetical protein
MASVLPALRRQAELVLAGRAFDLALIATGALVVALIAPATGSLVRIATGFELMLAGLLRLALKGQMRAFWGALIASGFAAPLMAIGSSPIFTDRGFSVQVFIEYGGLTAPFTLMLVLAGALGWKLTPPEPAAEPPWVGKLDRAMHLALTLGAAGLVFAGWGPVSIALVTGCALILAVGLAAVLALRMRWSRVGLGGLLAVLGAGASGTAAWLVLTQGGRVSAGEGALGLVPGLGLVLVGLLLALGWRAHERG